MATDLDLAPIIEAAELFMYTENHASQCMCDLWPKDCRIWPGGVKSVTFSVNAEDVITAAAPLIERAVRERASAELRAWADQIQDPGISGPRAIRRRTLMAAASKILPKLSPAELAEKIASGEAFVMHCTALDIEDDQPLLSVEGKDTND